MDDKGAYSLFLTGNQYVVNGRGQRFISLQGLAVYALTTVHFLIGNLEVELHKSVEEAARLMRLGQGAAMWPAALGFLKPDHGSFGRLRIRISH